jgi:hypothetical protein
VWIGAVGRHGYGVFAPRHATVRAHRYAWELTNGPIPTGLVVAHRCDNTRCVRPDHLFLATQAENLADMRAKGRAEWQRQNRHAQVQ